MFVAVLFVTIVLAGTSFLLWFLAGLLRERMPSTQYWMVSFCRRTEEGEFEPADASGADDGYGFERERAGFCVELEGNKFYAKKRASGLMSLYPRPAVALPGRSSEFKSARFLREQHF
jgi:hypothetical protein